MNLVALFLVLALWVTTVAGSACNAPPCGRVNNGSPYTLKWADLATGPHYCQVYNWHGGGGGETWSSSRRKCRQDFVRPGANKGGYFNDRVDVDAFTYADRDYKIQWNSGRKYTLTKGVWTKIKSTQTALCKDINGDGTPECFIA